MKQEPKKAIPMKSKELKFEYHKKGLQKTTLKAGKKK